MTSTQNEKSHADRSEMRDCRGSGQTRWLAAGGPTVGIEFVFKLCQCAVPRFLILYDNKRNRSCYLALTLQITSFEQASGATSDIHKSQFTKKKQFSDKKMENRGESIAN